MMNTVTHEIPFSFDHPDSSLGTLQKLITQRLRWPLVSNTSREMIVRNALNVLVIDMNHERAQYLGSLFVVIGYRPIMVANALDAFTHVLQGDCAPLAIIMGQKDGSNRLFLTRLLQQLVQRYDWEPLLVHLQFAAPQSHEISTNNQPVLGGYQSNMPPMPSTPSTKGPISLTSFPPTSPSAQSSPAVPTNTAPLGYPGVNRSSWSGLQSSPPHSLTPTPPANNNSPSLASSTSFTEGFPPLASGPDRTSQLPFSDMPPAQNTPPSFMALRPTAMNAPSPAQPKHEQRNDTAGPLLPGKQEKVYLDGQSLGRFQVRSRLGSSPYSEVYKIYDRLREKECALKAIQVDIVPFYMMDQSLEEITVFQQETELLGSLKHPHILPVFNWGKTYVSGANFIYKSMPLCSDGNLGSWLYRNGKPGSFSFKEIVPMVLQMADALQFAHNFQVTYQNFKLNNILVLTPTKRIQKLEVAFSDFSVVQDGSFISTAPDSLAYIAPERWDGIAHPASDQYGLAALAYELFTGRPPFQANSERTMKILHTTRLPQPPSSLNPKLPNALNAVLLRALAKNPSERFASMQHFMQALQQC